MVGSWIFYVNKEGITVPQGKVKFFNEAKGFGFITPDDGSNDLFIHITNLSDGPIQEGDTVRFEVGEGQKGPEARDVSIV
jgi:CspA family cold shock protein